MEQHNGKRTSDHLANERTYLAWIRTSIGIMAFGFVVMKFSLFVRQLGTILGKELKIAQHGYSTIIGISLVAAGLLTTLFAFIRFKKTQAQIDAGTYRSSSLLIGLLTAFIFLVSVLLIGYLLQTT